MAKEVKPPVEPAVQPVPTWADIEEAFMRCLLGLFERKHIHAWGNQKEVTVYREQDQGKIGQKGIVPFGTKYTYHCPCGEIKVTQNY